MCRNIRVLHHFEPPSTADEIRAAAEQYVRKVSGSSTKPPKSDLEEITRAVEAIAKATTRLLENLPERGAARTREGERERARKRWIAREARIVGTVKKTSAARRPKS